MHSQDNENYDACLKAPCTPNTPIAAQLRHLNNALVLLYRSNDLSKLVFLRHNDDIASFEHEISNLTSSGYEVIISSRNSNLTCFSIFSLHVADYFHFVL